MLTADQRFIDHQMPNQLGFNCLLSTVQTIKCPGCDRYGVVGVTSVVGVTNLCGGWNTKGKHTQKKTAN